MSDRPETVGSREGPRGRWNQEPALWGNAPTRLRSASVQERLPPLHIQLGGLLPVLLEAEVLGYEIRDHKKGALTRSAVPFVPFPSAPSRISIAERKKRLAEVRNSCS